MKSLLGLVLVALLVTPRIAFCAQAAVPTGVLNLNASVSREVGRAKVVVTVSGNVQM